MHTPKPPNSKTPEVFLLRSLNDSKLDLCSFFVCWTGLVEVNERYAILPLCGTAFFIRECFSAVDLGRGAWVSGGSGFGVSGFRVYN